MKIFSKKNDKKAYSLIEISIVILILSIMVSGALTISTVNSVKSRVITTNDRINQIYSALGSYLLANKKLPCPASIIEAKGVVASYGAAVGLDGTCSGSGVYQSSSSSNLVYGMIPVSTLGLPSDMAEDAFGTKIAYIVDKNFTSSTNFGKSSYNSAANLTLNQILQDGSVKQISNGAIFTIISYGPNKAGGIPVNAVDLALQNVRSSDIYEASNDISSGSFDNVLVSSVVSSESFDDIIFYKNRNNFVSDFNALFLIKCPATSGTSNDLVITYGTSTTTFSWPESEYDQIISSSVECPSSPSNYYQVGVKYPTRKCGAFGLWETNSNNNLVNNCSNGIHCSIPATGRYLTSNSMYDGNSPDNTTIGSTIYLSCMNGYGHAIGSGGDLSCGISSSDRSSTSPSITCQSNGTWSEIINDCTICRNCNSSTGTVTGKSYCLSIKNDRNDCYGVDGYCPGYNPYYFGLVNMNHNQTLSWCQRQSHDDETSGNFSIQCLDGIYNVRARCACADDDGTNYLIPNNYWGGTGAGNGTCPEFIENNDCT